MDHRLKPQVTKCLLTFAAILFLGCDNGKPLPAPEIDFDAPVNDTPYGYVFPEDVVFDDNVESNAQPEPSTFDLEFLDRFGKEIRLRDFQGVKNIVLVVTRGFNGYFCPYCNAQTSRLIRNHDKFEERNAEVIVVYPGEATMADEFAKKVSEAVDKSDDALPLSIVLDEDMSAVNRLMIKGDLAKPSTYIIDQDGSLQFAYVGRTRSDRPSLKAILGKLDKINAKP